MTVLLALCADVVFGLGVALQIRAAVQAPIQESLRPGLLVGLVQRPVWLAGLLLEIGGFALHAAALAHGSLVLVQPLLTLDLVFTLAICAAWSRSRLTSRDWLGVVATIVGVSMFLLVASPDRTSRAVADPAGWLLCAAWVVVVGGGVALWAARSMGIRRSALLAVAAGIANGFMAVLTKAFADKLEHGVWQTLRSWQPYGVVAAGVVAMLLIQSAYQAGHPTVVLPTINVVDPLVSSLVGVTLFGESVALTGIRGLAVVASITLAVVGLVALGRNPLVQREELPIAEIAS